MPELAKLTIMPLDGKMANQRIEVMFNPKEYTITKSTPWKHHDLMGHDAPTIEFTSGEPHRCTFELFFDCYEKYPEEKIRDLTDKIEKLTLVDGDIHRPPTVLLTWGKGLSFKCVLESFTIRFTLFHEDGTPLRAIMNTVWKEFYETTLQGKTEPRHSADRTKRRVVKQGDTLSWIAGKEYDDPTKWRIIADANGIDDPSTIAPGTELIIPPLL
jgi:LysM repeat protein